MRIRSFTQIVVIAAVAALPTACCEETHSSDPLQGSSPAVCPADSPDDRWTVHVKDGKSDHPVERRLLPACTPLDNYVENLRIVAPWEVQEALSENEQNPFEPPRLKVTKIAEWYDLEVLDLTSESIRHKSIVLRYPDGNHRILYAQFYWSTIDVKYLPYLVVVKDQTILAYETCTTGGNHSQAVRYYFAYDKGTGRPVSIDLRVIEKTLKEVLPEGALVWSGIYGFDIGKLTYSAPVWLKRDGIADATGGTVDLVLDLRDNELVVVSTKYAPTPQEDD